MGGALGLLLFSSLLAAAEPPELTPTGFGMALFKMVAALVLVCVLAYVALRLARRHLLGRSPRNATMRVLERCPLSTRQTLWIVEVGSRCFLIGAAEGTIAKLAELDPSQVEEVKALESPPSRSFWEVLRGRPKDGGDK